MSSLNHVGQRTLTSGPSNNGNVGTVEADSNNNGQTTTSLHQLLYQTTEDYAPTSGNHVSSSQQGNEFNEDCRFQYVLAAATSIATKVNEETLTYLNQGQSYEIKLKKLGDLSAYRGKILKVLMFTHSKHNYSIKNLLLQFQSRRFESVSTKDVFNIQKGNKCWRGNVLDLARDYSRSTFL